MIFRRVWVPYNPPPEGYYDYLNDADPMYQPNDGADETIAQNLPSEKPTEELRPASMERGDPRASVDLFDEEDDTPPKEPLTEQRQRRRLALIFGNDNYAPPLNLSYCRKNAQDMETMLKTLDFDCTVALDSRRRMMMGKEKSFRDKLRQGDCVLVYFSGYGMEDKVRSDVCSAAGKEYRPSA